MRSRFPLHAALAASLALGLAAPAALAQQTGTDQTQGAAPAGGTIQARVQQHIAELHKRLHITQAEEPQWQAFAQVMEENAAHMQQAFAAREQAGPNMNAVEDMKSYAAIAQTHAEDMQHLLPAFQQLYAAMSPAQQKNADDVFRQFEDRRAARHKAG